MGIRLAKNEYNSMKSNFIQFPLNVWIDSSRFFKYILLVMPTKYLQISPRIVAMITLEKLVI